MPGRGGLEEGEPRTGVRRLGGVVVGDDVVGGEAIPILPLVVAQQSAAVADVQVVLVDDQETVFDAECSGVAAKF